MVERRNLNELYMDLSREEFMIMRQYMRDRMAEATREHKEEDQREEVKSGAT